VQELQCKLKKHVDKAQLVRARKDRLKRQLETAPAQPQASGGWFGKLLG
jgi:hypothetical protein